MEILDVENKCYYKALKEAAVCIERYPVKIELYKYNLSAAYMKETKLSLSKCKDKINKLVKIGIEHAHAVVYVNGMWQRIGFSDGKYIADGYCGCEEAHIISLTLSEYTKWLEKRFMWGKR